MLAGHSESSELHLPLHTILMDKLVTKFMGETCRHEMFVMMQWERLGLAVPLSQLKPISNTGKNTKEAVADWHYWMNQGYVL